MTDEPRDGPPITIRGGAGPMEAAAIAAVIQRMIADERAAAAKRPNRRTMSPWLVAGRHESFVPPGRTAQP